MKAGFLGDPTTGLSKRTSERADFDGYAENSLWRDGSEPLINTPRLYATKGDVPALGAISERVIEQNEFERFIQQYWIESSFKYSDGNPAILDLVCFLGRQRSTDDHKFLAALKEMSTLAIRAEREALLRSGDIQPISIRFFHVFDEADPEFFNFHLHTLLLLT